MREFSTPSFSCVLKYFVHLLSLIQIEFAGGGNLSRKAQTSLSQGTCLGRHSLSCLTWGFSGASFQWDVLRKPPQRGVQEVSDTEPPHLAPIDAEELSPVLPQADPDPVPRPGRKPHCPSCRGVWEPCSCNTPSGSLSSTGVPPPLLANPEALSLMSTACCRGLSAQTTRHHPEL